MQATHTLTNHSPHDRCGSMCNLTRYAELMNATGKSYETENCHWGDCTANDASSCPTKDWCPFNFYRCPIYNIQVGTRGQMPDARCQMRGSTFCACTSDAWACSQDVGRQQQQARDVVLESSVDDPIPELGRSGEPTRLLGISRHAPSVVALRTRAPCTITALNLPTGC